MTLQVSGRIHSATQTEQKGDNFRVRSFILDCTETNATGQTYANFAQFQLINNNCDLLNGFQPGQPVKVTFNVRGSFWQDKCITNLNAWKIEPATHVQQQPAPVQQQPAAQQQQWPQQTQATPTPNQWQPAPAPAQQQWGQPQAQQQQWNAQPQQQDNQNLPF